MEKQPLEHAEAIAEGSAEGLFDVRQHPLLERAAVRQSGIYGPRNSGKTCYLASLYGDRSNNDLDFRLSFNDDDGDQDQSIDRLDQAWKALQSGSVPPATPLVNPFRLSLTATYGNKRHNKVSWQFRTLLCN